MYKLIHRDGVSACHLIAYNAEFHKIYNFNNITFRQFSCISIYKFRIHHVIWWWWTECLNRKYISLVGIISHCSTVNCIRTKSFSLLWNQSLVWKRWNKKQIFFSRVLYNIIQVLLLICVSVFGTLPLLLRILNVVALRQRGTWRASIIFLGLQTLCLSHIWTA
jgi:hypothetical protein